MSETILNTRIRLKYDTHENWTKNNPVLMSGELAIVLIPAEAGVIQQEPAVLMKVGDGTSDYKSLPFSSARSADIYNWAKAATKPTYTANEIGGLKDYISGQVNDTDTQYKLEQDATNPHILKFSSKPLGGSWTVVATLTTPDTVYNDTALKNRVSAVEALIGSTAVATQIANAIAALNLDKTYEAKGSAAAVKAELDTLSAKIGNVTSGSTLSGLVSANKAAIDALNGTGTGSVDKKVADAVAAIVADAPEAYNTLKEISDWITTHSSDASGMNTRITTNTSDLDALKKLVGTLPSGAASSTIVGYINEMISASGHQANVIESIKVNGASLTPDSKKSVNITVPTGALANKSKVAKSDLDTNLTAELNKKVNGDDLSQIAMTGNVNDLVQTTGSVLIFNCGSASTVL